MTTGRARGGVALDERPRDAPGPAVSVSSEPRLAVYVDVIRTVLRGYLEHLARSWRRGGDSMSTVGSVLDAVGRSIAVDDESFRVVQQWTVEISHIEHGPLAFVTRRLRLDQAEELVVAATWWSEVDPQLGSVFGVLHDDGNRRHASTGLLHLVLAPYGLDVPIHPRRLVAEGLVSTAGPAERIALTPTARELLGQGVHPRGGDSSALPSRLVPMVAPVAELVGSATGTVAIRGPAGCGNRALAHAAVDCLGRAVVDRDRSDAELRLLAKLDVAVPVLEWRDAVDLRWPRQCGPLIVLAGPDDEPSVAHVVDVAMPTRIERQRLWRDVLESVAAGDDVVVHRLADQFHFTEPDVEATAARARLRSRLADRAPTARDVWVAAQHQPDVDLVRVATRIEPVFTLADLVLTADVRAQLRELVAHVRHRATVLDEWGFRSRLPRGQGVAALFSGPPGTGKTTAAEAIAHELSADLFRIDLSRVVSKYIGETEKNLAIAFREAERSGALLLFDEADALFGKRTDVRDAHDRYANLEVSYLLQRVETFTGLVILSTNKPGHVDDAFLRRLRFVVRFDAPGPADRAEIWRRSFPPGAVLRDVDWSELAGHDLTGGHIQNAALSAAFLAVDDGGAIDRSHIDRAIAREYEKLDRAAPPSESRA